MAGDLAGAHALVTGGGRGIGLAIATALGSAGARVTLVGRDGARLDKAALSLRERKIAVQTVPCDVSDAQSVARAFGVARQGFGAPAEYGPKAPATIKALLGHLHAARVRGYAMIDEVFAPGMNAMAAPVLRRRQAIGVISIAGPRQRLTPARMHELAPELLACTFELGPVSDASILFGKPPLGKG